MKAMLSDVTAAGQIGWGSMWAGVPARIAHTGYTGEAGFEIYIPPAEAERIWGLVLEAGAEYGIKPCGLGARNTLRLEA